MIDTHAHLYLLKQPLKQVVAQARQAGVKHIINVALCPETATRASVQAAQYPGFISSTLGIHPCETEHVIAWDVIRKRVLHQPIVAVGECGLDYRHMTTTKDRQHYVFLKQLELAAAVGLPVIIHNRKADDDVVRCLQQFPGLKVVLHCFVSGPRILEQVPGATTYYSFTGALTHTKKGKTIQALKKIPFERLMIETDCPYLLPKTVEAPENAPHFVAHVAQKIAAVKAVSVAETVRRLTRTSLEFFDRVVIAPD